MLLGIVFHFLFEEMDSLSLSYSVEYYNNTVDHLHPFPSLEYSQKYLISDEHWGSGEPLSENCQGPIFFYSGNEGPVEGFWDGNGFMKELAEKVRFR